MTNNVTRIDTAREVGLRRQLYGHDAKRQRSTVEVVRDFAAAVEQLHLTAKAWTAIHPRAVQVEAVQHAVVGLGRLLSELRAMQGGPTNAA